MPKDTIHAYASGYGPNITHFTLDRASGALAKRGAIAGGGAALSFLAVAPSGRALYVVNEASGPASAVIAFAIDPADGELREINRAPSGGDGAPHLAVHPSGRYLAVAHYGSGHVSLLPVRDDLGVDPPTISTRGPNDACRKAHQAVFNARGTHLLVPCLGSDCVLQFRFADGVLSHADQATVHVAGGPRHLAFAPGERRAYVLSELQSLITSFAYDPAAGTLHEPHVIDSHEQIPGASAHIAVHPTGRFLYASNRSENSIATFSLDAAGHPHPSAFERTGISTPRHFAIDPTGEYLIAANQEGDQALRVYRINADNGRLTFLHHVPLGGHPTCIAFAVLH